VFYWKNDIFIKFCFGILITSIIFTAMAFSATPVLLNNIKNWFIVLDYDEAVKSPLLFDSSLSDQFEMAILDPDHHPSLKDIQEDVVLIAYVSVGEAEDYRFYWKDIATKPWIMGENPDWDGNYYVDARNEEWQQLIMEEVIPRIMKEGFEGLMLDTLDTAEMLEESLPEQYLGARQAMVNFVREIHETYPNLYLISNNGFSILEDIAPYLSGVLVEDIHWMVDFEHGGYKKVPVKERKYKVEILKKVRQHYPLTVFNIDYVPQDKQRTIKKCIKRSRRLGFKPYVAEKGLGRIYFP